MKVLDQFTGDNFHAYNANRKAPIELGVTRCTLKKYLDDKKGLNHQVINGRLFAALGLIL